MCNSSSVEPVAYAWQFLRLTRQPPILVDIDLGGSDLSSKTRLRPGALQAAFAVEGIRSPRIASSVITLSISRSVFTAPFTFAIPRM